MGKNNKFTKEIAFEFDMINYKVARAVFSDHNSTRFNISEKAVPRPSRDTSMRLESLGFGLYSDPFYFELKDVTSQDNVYVTTKDMSLVMSDKFIQMDFLLPS